MLPIVTLPDDRLFQKSADVTTIDGTLNQFVQDMIKTMIEADGIGLAAVQVGSLQRLFVVRIPNEEALVFINPTILQFSDTTGPYEEGCLSIPGIYSDIIRPLEINVKAVDLNGSEFTLDADGLLARVIQHEYDHLNGTLFYQLLKPRQQERFLRVYERERGAETSTL